MYMCVSKYVCDLGRGPCVSGLQSPQLVNEEGKSNDLWFPVGADTLGYLLGHGGRFNLRPLALQVHPLAFPPPCSQMLCGPSGHPPAHGPRVLFQPPTEA